MQNIFLLVCHIDYLHCRGCLSCQRLSLIGAIFANVILQMQSEVPHHKMRSIKLRLIAPTKQYKPR